MCHFLSAVVTQDGTLHCYPEQTDSHSEILRIAGIRDDAGTFFRRLFLRLELVPPVPDIHVNDESGRLGQPRITVRNTAELLDPSKWTFVIDEDTGDEGEPFVVPEWFPEAEQARVRALMEERVRRMIIDAPRVSLMHGRWILGPNANISQIGGTAVIERAIGSRISRVAQWARIEEALGCSIDQTEHYAHLGVVSGCKIEAATGYTNITVMRYSRLGHAADGVVIGGVTHDSSIGRLYGTVYNLMTGSIVELLKGGRIHAMTGLGQTSVAQVSGVSFVDRLNGNAYFCIIEKDATLVLGTGNRRHPPTIEKLLGRIVVGSDSLNEAELNRAKVAS